MSYFKKQRFKNLRKVDRDLIFKLWIKVEKDTNKYGTQTNTETQCLRVKHPERYKKDYHICGINKKLFHYTISYAYHNHKIPNTMAFPKHVISHICGNPKSTNISLCVKNDHLCVEETWENNERQKCHKAIRKFYAEFNKKKYKNIISNKGKLTIKIIKQRLKESKITQSEYKIERICDHTNKRECFIIYK